jgi:hypothetical protein
VRGELERVISEGSSDLRKPNSSAEQDSTGEDSSDDPKPPKGRVKRRYQVGSSTDYGGRDKLQLAVLKERIHAQVFSLHHNRSDSRNDR